MIEQTGYMLAVYFDITGDELAMVTDMAESPRRAANHAIRQDAEAICSGAREICPALGSCALSYFYKVHTVHGLDKVDRLSGGFICNRRPYCLDPELVLAGLHRLKHEFGRSEQP